MEGANVKVCILMTAYLDPYGKRAEYYLRRAIESILSQTYRDYKFCIVNDADHERVVQIASSYYDDRIVYIQNHKTIGLTASLNKALQYTEVPYILRQDADDVSHPQRLEKLLDVIEKDSTIGALGDNYGVLDQYGEVRHINGANPEIVPLSGLAGTIAGAGSILRTEAVKKVGGWKYEYAQDFYMWVVLKKAGYKIKTLQDTLYYYRQHPGQISQAKRDRQKWCHQEIIEKECNVNEG